MPINVQAQKWHLAYFVPIDGHFGQMFWDMNFIYINFNIQTKFEVNQTQIGHSILSQNKLQNIPKIALSQNPILPKLYSPKSLLLLHFSINWQK